MARARGSGVLKVVRPKKACTIRIDADLDDEIARFEERLKTEAPRCVFDRAHIIEEALRDALDLARAELAGMSADDGAGDASTRAAS